MSRAGSQPLIVLSDESQRTTGRDAQSMNITAGKAVATAVRTTLGPKGMDKMLVGSSGGVVVTNDGVTILEEMDIEHPAANMIVEVAETQEAEVGDGTTSAVIVAGELLAEAEELLERGVHASTLTRGYRQAAERSRAFLADRATSVEPDDVEYLQQLAATAMTGKGAEANKDLLAELVVDAIQSVADEDGVNTDHIDIQTKEGGAIEESELIDGMILKKTPPHQNMPLLLEDANVALLYGAMEVREMELDADVNISDPDELEQLLEQEEAQLKEMVDQLAELDVDAVFCAEGIDDLAQHYLAQNGMMALRRVSSGELGRLSRATGATPVNGVGELTEDHIGFAGTLVQRDIGDGEWLFVEDVEDAKSVTLLLQGGTEHVVDEVERAVVDSIGVVRTAMDEGEILPGGGAPEIGLSRELRSFADSVGGREQLAIEAFAEAVEVVPRTLAENAGHDTIDSIVALRAAHDGGDEAAGLDAYTGEVIDMAGEGVYEPLRVKTQAIDAATEAAVMILRIDDVIAAGDLAVSDDDDEMPPEAAGGPGGAPGGPGGAPGGMGGMGGGMGGMM